MNFITASALRFLGLSIKRDLIILRKDRDLYFFSPSRISYILHFTENEDTQAYETLKLEKKEQVSLQ